MTRQRQILSGIGLLLALAAVASVAFFIAEEVLINPGLQSLIASFGYLGITAFATVAGLNIFLPIPAATFTPIFIAAGLSLPLIILALTVGTLLADLIGFVFGRLSRTTIATQYPKFISRLEHIYAHKRHWLTLIVFIYAAFIPIPNEVLVIPLALLGVRWQAIILPLFFGNYINQTLYAYGFQYLFVSWW